MCITAAYEIAKYAEEHGMSETTILPTMADWDVFIRVAVAVGLKAEEQGVARENVNREVLKERAEKIITESRQTLTNLMKSGLIPPAPV
jgi:malate dehydrogenase (oxaloacetate-decarboxylating)